VGLTAAQITEQADALWAAQGSGAAIDQPTASYARLTANEAGHEYSARYSWGITVTMAIS
jgi:hypothetical protein